MAIEKGIQTVLGRIEPSNLGRTDMHNHLIRVAGVEVERDKDFLLNRVDLALEELGSYHSAGGEALVEMNAIGCGRDIEKLIEIANNTPVKIIAATGFHKGEFYPKTHWVHRYDVDHIAELVAKEVTEGIDLFDYSGPIVRRSPARAGVIKAASGYQRISVLEERLFRAVARAHLRTGAPVSTHTERGTMALEQIHLLTSEGVRPERIIIGHLDRNPDFYYHRQVASQGVFIIYDGASRVKYWPDGVLVELLRKMIGAGFGKQILLGSDCGRSSYWRAYGGGPGFDYTLRSYVPRLLEEGIPEEAVEDLLINNPRRALAF